MFGKSHGESEAQTRRKRIYPKLQSKGWSVVSFDPSVLSPDSAGVAVAEWQMLNGPADYALLEKGDVTAGVEAKKVTVGPQNVLTQAERYSWGFINAIERMAEDSKCNFCTLLMVQFVLFRGVR